MKVFFMGTPEYAAICLKKLYKSNHEVVGVFCQPDKPRGRGMKLVPCEVKVYAQEVGIPVYTPKKLRDGTALNIIKESGADIIAVVAYGRILPDEILNYPAMGSINMHGSLLPKYRGAAPIQWAIINGEKETGVTAMYMASELDAGDIISSVITAIGERETYGELYLRMADISAQLLCDTLDDIASGKIERKAQDGSLVTFAPPIEKDMTVIDWNKTADEICCFIRGLSPAPAAVCDLSCGRLKVYSASVQVHEGTATPGTIVKADKKGIYVACADGVVCIEELQATGGKRMTAASYLNGHPIDV